MTHVDTPRESLRLQVDSNAWAAILAQAGPSSNNSLTKVAVQLGRTAPQGMRRFGLQV